MSNALAHVAERDVAHAHPVHPLPAHVGLVDRLQLRVGLWLLLRGSQRVQRLSDHRAHDLLVRNERAREARELAAVRARALWPRP